MQTATLSRPLPKALQISEMLIREIASGRIPDGSRLPTEREMAEDLGIAVGTLRRSLAILEQKGLLRRVQGSGNYVDARQDVSSVYSFFRLELAGGGGLPTAKILSVDRLSKPVDMPAIGSGNAGHRIRRQRFIGSVSVALEEIWLDGRFTNALSADDLSDSLYLYYKDSLDLVISRIEDQVGVSSVPDWTVSGFSMQPGAVCGFIERVGKDQAGQPAEYSKTWFNHTVARHITRL